MNDDRAEWAASALHCFQSITGTDEPDGLTDLLCDLMHWCDRNGTDFDHALSLGRMHYEAETAPEPTEGELTPADVPISPIDKAKALTPRWMQNIRDFDALEIHPCSVIGNDSVNHPIVQQCEPEDAQFWTVFGHLRTGGVDDFEDLATEAEAVAFHDLLIAAYPHLAGED